MLGNQSPISLQLGQLGSMLITDTAHKTGTWGVIYATSATVIATLVSGNLPSGKPCMTDESGGGTLSAVALPAGGILYGYFTDITLTSGSVVAYNC